MPRCSRDSVRASHRRAAARLATFAVSSATLGAGLALAAPSASAAPISPDVGLRAVALAAEEAGDRYVWGATGPDAFDCSGLVQFVYRRLGVSVPRTTGAQFAAMQHLPQSEARPGDVLFFHDAAGAIYHDAIYAGNGKMWAAPHSGGVVRLQAVYGTAWRVGRPSPGGAASPAAPVPVALKVGSRGPAVAEAQRALGIPADGVYGPQTAATVARFQAERRLTADGVIGPQTKQLLLAGPVAPTAVEAPPAAAPRPQVSPARRPTLRQGDRGPDVAAMQRVLGVGVDGNFGPRTRAAVLDRQRRAGLAQDGVVGPRTWAAL